MNNNLKTQITTAIRSFFQPITFLIGLFKKKPKSLERTQQEINNDQYRAKYRMEFLGGVYYVQYQFKGQWWYLRKWDFDYMFEEKRGHAIRITDQSHIENVIAEHQAWIGEGHFFLPFKNYDS